MATGAELYMNRMFVARDKRGIQQGQLNIDYTHEPPRVDLRSKVLLSTVLDKSSALSLGLSVSGLVLLNEC